MNPNEWIQSTYCANGACVAVQWVRSSTCTGGACVEVAADTDTVQVRDAKQDDGPILTFAPDQWRAFIANVKGGGR